MENELLLGIAQVNIEKHAASIARDAVGTDIALRQERKKERIQSYVDEETPWHKSILNKIDLSGMPYKPTNEEIETRLQKEKFAQELAITRDVARILDEKNFSAIKDNVVEIVSKISGTSKDELIHYIALRKKILGIFGKSLELDESGAYSAEGVVHDIVFPRKRDTETTSFEDHNLWIVDERLNFTNYVSSDVPLDGKNTERPDLLVYNRRVLFRGNNEASNPVTIFEFKKPQRDDFVNPSSTEDPVQQIVRYVNGIRDGKYKTPEGRNMLVGENTPFYGFVVCDLTKKVEAWLEREKDFKPMPDRLGWFQWLGNINLEGLLMAAKSLALQVGVAPACRALGVPRATFYRRHRSTPGRQQPRSTPARALCEDERERVLETLSSSRFVDRSPGEVVATLLDEGQYLCSERTMYRILAASQPVRERRNQLTHPSYTKPELVATAPNETWSWDITRLLGPKRWTYFYLYVLLDIFSRYVVGWMVAERESSALAARLIEQTCLKQGIEPQTLTLHSDRGAPMTSKCTAQLLADLGVTRSLSRPQVSDDNPFSEAQFKTLKYHPGFPGRFEDAAVATAFCRSFFPWYNTEHRHGGIAMLTPHDVHYGQARQVLEQRERILRLAWNRHPERFVHGTPKPQPLPQEVWINPPAAATTPRPAQ